jgi:hypothetical protein
VLSSGLGCNFLSFSGLFVIVLPTALMEAENFGCLHPALFKKKKKKIAHATLLPHGTQITKLNSLALKVKSSCQSVKTHKYLMDSSSVLMIRMNVDTCQLILV